MKVEFIKPPAPLGLAYFVGDVAEFESEIAEKLIKDGYAIEFKEPKKGKKEAE